jgi:hypothetical protein
VVRKFARQRDLTRLSEFACSDFTVRADHIPEIWRCFRRVLVQRHFNPSHRTFYAAPMTGGLSSKTIRTDSLPSAVPDAGNLLRRPLRYAFAEQCSIAGSIFLW